MIKCLYFAIVLGLAACKSTPIPPDLRVPAVFDRADHLLNEADIQKAASSTALKIEKARVIIDNDASFDSKIEAIRSARADETIRLSYYIYSDDHSSSVFSEELLKAAKRGVNIRLVVDFLTNYKLLDLFTMLESESNNRIQVKFYGRPNSVIVRDAIYLTQPCPEITGKVTPKACSDYKWKNLRTDNPDYFARMLLSGIYGKSGAALQTSILTGQQIDLAAYKNQTATSEQDQKDLKEFFKLLFDAKFRGNTLSKIKVAIAMQMHAAKLNPIMNEIYGRLPLAQMGDASAREWEHISDFSHQKLLLVGNRYAQLGGRNIENSYHMKPNALIQKYIFMDTDMSVQISGGGESIAKAFDDIWDFEALTTSVSEVRKFMPNEFTTNTEAALETVQKCVPVTYKTSEQRQQVSNCIERELPLHSKFVSLQARLADAKSIMNKNSAIYRTQYALTKKSTETWRKGGAYSDQLDNQDISQMFTAYIENVPFDRTQSNERRLRKYGSVAGTELKDGKYIHYLWYKGLENTCAVAAREQATNPAAPKKRVILHSAYFLPPAILMKGLTKMMDGSWNCGNVHVTFLTNSFETTDLNIINVFARYQLMAFFEMYSSRGSIYKLANERGRSAEFDIYEYKKPASGSNLSLHTKLSLLGDDAIIGSANADVRSYFMDSNNAFYLHNVRGFAGEYSSWVDGMLKDPAVTKNLTAEYLSGQHTMASLRAEDRVMVNAFLERWKTGSPLKGKTAELAYDTMGSIGKFIVDTTRSIMDINFVVVEPSEHAQNNSKQLKEQADLEKKFNELLQLL